MPRRLRGYPRLFTVTIGLVNIQRLIELRYTVLDVTKACTEWLENRVRNRLVVPMNIVCFEGYSVFARPTPGSQKIRIRSGPTATIQGQLTPEDEDEKKELLDELAAALAARLGQYEAEIFFDSMVWTWHAKPSIANQFTVGDRTYAPLSVFHGDEWKITAHEGKLRARERSANMGEEDGRYIFERKVLLPPSLVGRITLHFPDWLRQEAGWREACATRLLHDAWNGGWILKDACYEDRDNIFIYRDDGIGQCDYFVQRMT